MRLHELAKKLGVSSKEIMDACREQGFPVRSHFVKATPEIVLAMNKVFGGRSAARVAVEKKPAPRRTARRQVRKAAAAEKKEEKKEPAKKPTPKREEKQPQKRAAKEKQRTAKPPAKEKEAPSAPKPEPEAGEQAETEAPAPPRVEHRAHRPRRADFRSRASRPAMPAEAQLSERYADMVYGRERRTRGRRRRKRRRPNPAAVSAQTKRDGPSKTSLRKRATTPEDVLELTPPVTPRALSAALGVKLDTILRHLIDQGVMAGINDPLPDEALELIGGEHGKEVRFSRAPDVAEQLEAQFRERAEGGELVDRSPVVAFLGHVDHGKTSLLDHIRRSHVVDSEAGGITQHIGAYRIQTDGTRLCFLDTPGHEAFSAMRARGANLTDIVVLVVAADDGVMPQTREAYAHTRAAGVPVVVALNKCDLPNANPQRVMQELSSLDEALLPEQWGGKTGVVEVSAATGQNMEELLERIALEAELLELKADPKRPAEGHVLEAKLTSERGVVANLLIQDGTLHRGDILLCGAGYGRVKLMFDEQARTLQEAGPATPVSVTGLSAVPEAGDRFIVVDDLQKAREASEQRGAQARTERRATRQHVSLENLTQYLKSTEAQELRVVLKADVMGSLEVLHKTLNDLSTEEVKVNIIHEGVGGINQADVILADASDALVVGFHVTADAEARRQAEARQVEVKVYHIIYRITEDMKAALSGLLPPEEREIVQGHLVVRQVFRASRLGRIAGCYVQDGMVSRNSRVRVFRDNVLLHDGRVASLYRFKDQVRDVREGFECGLRIEGFNTIEQDDTIEAYTTEEVARTLE